MAVEQPGGGEGGENREEVTGHTSIYPHVMCLNRVIHVCTYYYCEASQLLICTV